MANYSKQLKSAGKELMTKSLDFVDKSKAIEMITCHKIEISKFILRQKYIEKETDIRIMEMLEMPRSTYYDNLDMAHELLGLQCLKMSEKSGLSLED